MPHEYPLQTFRSRSVEKKLKNRTKNNYLTFSPIKTTYLLARLIEKKEEREKKEKEERGKEEIEIER